MDADNVRALLAEAAKTLRVVQAEKEKLASALGAYQRKEQAEEIVALMESRGLGDGLVPYKQKVATVLASKKDLALVKEALQLQTTDMSFARVAEEADLGNHNPHAFVEYLLR
jgi:hypothetical protein